MWVKSGKIVIILINNSKWKKVSDKINNNGNNWKNHDFWCGKKRMFQKNLEPRWEISGKTVSPC